MLTAVFSCLCCVVFHRKLQEDLTDEMVVLARQLKESSLMMNQSIKNTEKVSRVLFASTVSQCNFFGDMTQSLSSHSFSFLF